jgi:hypothetical protein
LLEVPGAYSVDGGRLVTETGSPLAAIWNQQFGARQEAYVTFSSISGDEDEMELILHNQNVVSECESVVVSFNQWAGPKAVHVGYCAGGNWTDIPPSVPLALVSGDRLWARIDEKGIVEVFVNGSKIGTWDASGAPFGKSGGRVGLYTTGLPEQIKMDDFGGGNW